MTRIKFFQIIVFIAAIGLVARLFYWQFVADVVLPSNLYSQEVILSAPRGEVYTSDGFPIIVNQEAFLVYVKPNDISGKVEDIAKDIAPLLISEKYSTASASLSEDEERQKDEEIKAKENDISQKLSTRKLFWVQIARKVPLLVKEKLEALNIEGLGFERDEKRFYPEGSMAAQLMGFVGSDKFGEDTGYFGLEGYYNRQLKGKSGRLGQDRDPLGFPILVGKYRPIEPKKGDSLYLTLDRSIQFIVEQKLRRAVENYGAKEGTVIVSEPSTGNILAMATYPAYHPGLFGEYDEDYYKNQAVADIYEPGSIFKLVTVAAALDSSVVDPNTRCNICSGPRQMSGFEISTWNKKYYPDSTVSEIIEHSDNVGMTFVSEKLGIKKFYDYITKFGFGKTTGIDLQEEASGSIRAKDKWRIIDLATASFGQGIGVTPIQMVQAVGAIANKGELISPKVVRKIDESGKEKIVKPDNISQVVSAKTAAQVTEMMVNAVVNGEAQAFAPKGYRIAGKTGTAQIPVAGHYDPEKTIASFIGFAPASDPRFVMLVRFTEPSSSPFGSETAAPTFFAIAKEILSYMGISPSKN